MKLAISLVLALAVGCGGKAKPAPTSSGSGSGAVAAQCCCKHKDGPAGMTDANACTAGGGTCETGNPNEDACHGINGPIP